MTRIWSYLFSFALLILPVVPAVAEADTSAICLIGDHPGIPESDAQTVALLVCDELRKQGISITDPVYEAPVTANAYRVVLRRLGEKIIVRLSQENPIGTIIAERQLTLANIEEMIPAAPRLVDALINNKPIAIFNTTGINPVKAAKIDAEQDAKNDVDVGSWFAMGLLGGAVSSVSLVLPYLHNDRLWGLGCLGFTVGGLPPISAILHRPSPPAKRFLGRSPEYVKSYTETYVSKVRQRRGISSAAGCIIGYMGCTPIVFAVGQ